jgi:hypothetical protein
MTYVLRAGTSIWEMVKRATSIAAAARGVGMRGTRRSRMFEGKCENSIVFMAPNLLTKYAAATPDSPATTFAHMMR